MHTHTQLQNPVIYQIWKINLELLNAGSGHPYGFHLVFMNIIVTKGTFTMERRNIKYMTRQWEE